MSSFTLESVAGSLAELGLIARGAFHPTDDDCVPALAGGLPAATVIIVGNAGPDWWRAFSAAGGESIATFTCNVFF